MTIDPSNDWPLLAIETSSSVCAVAAVAGEEIFENTRYLERLHNQQVLAMIEDVTTRLRAALADRFGGFKLVAFGRGPGSFTGVRIGAALAQALAYAHDAQVLALPSLQVLAHSVWNRASSDKASAQHCIAFVRSRQQAYYVQGFELASATSEPLPAPWQPQTQPQLIDNATDLAAWVATAWPQAADGSVVGVGQRPPWLDLDLDLDLGPTWLDANPEHRITAAGLLEVASIHRQQGLMRAIQQALPEYIEADSPWQAAP